MSNISINQASKLFKVSRNTIYARIKKGDLTKNADGLVSVQDMMRVFGNKADKKATEQAVIELLNSTNNIEQSIQQQPEQSKSSNEQLLQQQIEQLKLQVEQLEKQLEYVKANEAWLKQQLDQKLIEHKPQERKGLLSKIFG
jgi:polyhydroxyalkanoate synthesis regulator phasin